MVLLIPPLSNVEQSESNGPAVTTIDCHAPHLRVNRMQKVRKLAAPVSSCPLRTTAVVERPGQMGIFGGRKMNSFMVRTETAEVLELRILVADGVILRTSRIASLRRVLRRRRRKKKRRIVGHVLRTRILWRVATYPERKRSQKEPSRQAAILKLVRGAAIQSMSSQKTQREVCMGTIEIQPSPHRQTTKLYLAMSFNPYILISGKILLVALLLCVSMNVIFSLTYCLGGRDMVVTGEARTGATRTKLDH